MNQFDKFKQYMDKLGAKFHPAKPAQYALFTMGKCLEIQVTSTKDQHETDLVAVNVNMRQNGYFFPLGTCWAVNALDLIEKIEKILIEYDIQKSLTLRACW